MKPLLPTLALLCAAALALPALARAQAPNASSDYPKTEPAVPLWEGDAPGAIAKRPMDVPRMQIWRPDPALSVGTAIVICPGGGYGGLAPHEGAGYAQWLAARGVTAIVLSYRLSTAGYHHPAMLDDATRALRVVRANAAKWNLDPRRIGIMGSSAGGHLASTLLTHYDAGNPRAASPVDRVSSRPDFGILCYPVITMGEYTHAGSREGLLGKEPAPELVELLSNEKQVTDDTPPTFIWHCADDGAVVPENALLFALALRGHKVPFELHIYEKGGHGFGLGENNAHPWPSDLLYWMKGRGLVQQSISATPVGGAAPAAGPMRAR